jgi:cation transport ATPase
MQKKMKWYVAAAVALAALVCVQAMRAAAPAAMTTIWIEKMHCNGCAKKVASKLLAVRGVANASADVRTQIAFALAVKAGFVVLTLVGYASLWAAIAADTGASLLVIFNGLRLLRGTP